MLERRDPQRNLFDADSLPHRVPPDSFYGRMAVVSDLLFRDDDLKDLYDPGNGRPSLPPSLMSGVLLLQFYDDISDREAAERLLYDLHWKVARHLPLDYAGFDPSTLSYFRRRLADNGQERYAFDRFLAVGRTAGLIPDKVTLLTDTTWVKGAGAVQDTYTLLGKGIRKLLRTLGYATPSKRAKLSDSARQLIATYLDEDRKADIDWTDPQQRARQLTVLVQDAEAVLEIAVEHNHEADVRAVGWQLTKILGDDIVVDDHGDPQIGEGTAPDRVISLTDPEMRHGRKSKAQRFDGFKVAVATEPETELILDVTAMSASDGDGRHLVTTINRVETYAGVAVERVIGDGAYGSGANFMACADHPGHAVDLVTPVPQPDDPEVALAAFTIDSDQRTAVCPAGQTARGVRTAANNRPILRFTFTRSVCEACRLFPRCVHSQHKGRTVNVTAYEPLLRRARARQETDAFKTLYRRRSRVERKQAEMVRHGLRYTRNLGSAKRRLKLLWTAAAVNLKRLFRLAAVNNCPLRLVFT